MYHSTSSYDRTYDRDYDNRDRHGSWWSRPIGIGMGYSAGAGEAKRGETSERIGDYRDDRYYGNTGFGSNYGTGSSYTYGYPYEHNRYNTYSTSYPTTHYGYDTNRFDTNRFNTSYDTNRYSGYSNYNPNTQYYGSNPTGYRTVTETREIVRDSDRPFGHSNVYGTSHYNRDHNRDYDRSYNTYTRDYSNHGRF